MVDQAEIHRKAVSGKVEERGEAVWKLWGNFADLPDKEEAWGDLIRLTVDEGKYVRRNATLALGSVFPHIPDKKQAWEDLIRLTRDKDISVWTHAVNAVVDVFPPCARQRKGMGRFDSADTG